MGKESIVYLSIKDVRPYKNNPRKAGRNGEAVDAVAASIKEYGFKSPIIITPEHEIINGHTRFKAAKKLGLKEIPCVIATDLTAEQVKQYRLIDNKTSEYARWDADLLEEELEDIEFALDFDFDFSGDLKKQNSWDHEKKLCDLKDKAQIRKASGIVCHTIFKTGKSGIPLEEIKTEEHVDFFASTATEYIRLTLGNNLSECDWCLLTAPRRRHAEGFHFATEICNRMSDLLNIRFYKDCILSYNRDRINPEFELVKSPEEKNVILYDDIVTTGVTIKTARTLLINTGYTVFPIASVNN